MLSSNEVKEWGVKKLENKTSLALKNLALVQLRTVNNSK
ncbi:hypothetical protein MNB_SUP05-SYMBIONT-5-183 [hydrothermal vent metagenome]|uniref:Uncharacterized protein n=1 Tax=hydrothermal vent metagenome TaxID=652676 RepID=A0A1W1E4V9_9ZZZZ